MEHYRDGQIQALDVMQPLMDARRQRRRRLGIAPGTAGPAGPGGLAQPGGSGPAVERNKELFEQFDADKSGVLDAAERRKAREAAAQSGAREDRWTVWERQHRPGRRSRSWMPRSMDTLNARF